MSLMSVEPLPRETPNGPLPSDPPQVESQDPEEIVLGDTDGDA